MNRIGAKMVSVWHISELEIALRLVLALLLGGIIGFEREQANHAAGFRTNILVCVGACLMMLLSIYGFANFVDELNVRVDPARLAAAVITGVGFLGAGTIMFTGKKISGLTTAASLWVVAALGLAVGAGFYFAAIVVLVLVITTLWLFNKIEKRVFKNKKDYHVELNCKDSASLLLEIQFILDQYEAKMTKMSIEESPKFSEYTGVELPTHKEIRIHMDITIREQKNKDKIVQFINDLKKLEDVNWLAYS